MHDYILHPTQNLNLTTAILTIYKHNISILLRQKS